MLARNAGRRTTTTAATATQRPLSWLYVTSQRLRRDTQPGLPVHLLSAVHASQTGTRPAQLLYSEYENGVGKPVFLVIADVDRRAVVVAIRGTMSLSDTVTDAEAWGVHATFDEHTFEVHAGINQVRLCVCVCVCVCAPLPLVGPPCAGIISGRSSRGNHFQQPPLFVETPKPSI